MELNSNQVKALEMISAEFVDDIRLIREGITGDDLNYMEMVNLIDWDANRQAYIMLDAGNRELYIRNKHPLQLMSQGKTQTGATTAQRIAALEAENAALKTERDALQDHLNEAVGLVVLLDGRCVRDGIHDFVNTVSKFIDKIKLKK